MLWRTFQEIHMRNWRVLYTRVPEETDQNWCSPLRGRQNGPLMCQTGGGSMIHVGRLGAGRSFLYSPLKQ